MTDGMKLPGADPTRGVWTATVHQVADGLDRYGRQFCVVCGAKILDHSNQLATSDGAGRYVEGKSMAGFPAGPVTVISAPKHLAWATKAVAMAVEGATPCSP